MKGSAGIISDLSCKVLGKQIRTKSALSVALWDLRVIPTVLVRNPETAPASWVA